MTRRGKKLLQRGAYKFHFTFNEIFRRVKNLLLSPIFETVLHLLTSCVTTNSSSDFPVKQNGV